MDFQEKYKDYSDIKLIRILIREAEYQKPAVDAAKEELDNRNLTLEKIAELKNIGRQELKEEEEKVRIELAQIEERKDKFFNYFKSINPIRFNSTIDERLQLFVGFVFLIIYSEPFYYDLKFIYYSVSFSDLLEVPIISILINTLLFPITVYYYFKKTKVGWILITGILSYSLSSAFTIIGYTIKNSWNPLHHSYYEEQINYFWLILPAITYSILIVILFIKPVWKIYNVSTVQRVLSFTTGFIFWPILLMFFYLSTLI